MMSIAKETKWLSLGKGLKTLTILWNTVFSDFFFHNLIFYPFFISQLLKEKYKRNVHIDNQ